MRCRHLVVTRSQTKPHIHSIKRVLGRLNVWLNNFNWLKTIKKTNCIFLWKKKKKIQALIEIGLFYVLERQAVSWWLCLHVILHHPCLDGPEPITHVKIKCNCVLKDKKPQTKPSSSPHFVFIVDGFPWPQMNNTADCRLWQSRLTFLSALGLNNIVTGDRVWRNNKVHRHILFTSFPSVIWPWRTPAYCKIFHPAFLLLDSRQR